MTIFFDTKELKKDPLFYSHSMEIFFELSKAWKIKIYISEIVLSYELKKHYIKDFKEKLKSYNEASKQFHDFWDNKYNEKIYNNNKIKYNFKNRIKKLIKDNCFTIAKFDHENIINSMLDRYMESKAPFHEINKSSENKNDNNWKDYIIWESYKEIINSKEDIYIFISYNTDDFSDNKSNNNGNGIYNGHNDFYKDIIINKEKLNFYKTINGFLEENKEYQKIYTEYLINKYSNNGEISVIEELLLFTAKFVNKYDYKNNHICIRKIIITDGKNIIDIDNNKVNIEVLIEYEDTSSIAVGQGKKGKKNKKENITEKIETKCVFTIDIKNLKFSIDSIEGFEKSHNKNC